MRKICLYVMSLYTNANKEVKKGKGRFQRKLRSKTRFFCFFVTQLATTVNVDHAAQGELLRQSFRPGPVNHEGSYQDETKCIPTTSKILILYLKHILPLKIWRNLDKMKLNEPRRQKLGSL